MPKPEDYTRVKIDGTGAEVTVLNVRDGMTVIDKDATDKRGLPLPPKPKVTVREAAAKKTAAKKTTAGKKSASKTATAPVTSTTSGDSAAATSEEDSK